MQFLNQSKRATFLLALLFAGAALSATSAQAKTGAVKPEKERNGPTQPSPVPVPYQLADVILGQPTSNSVVFSLLRYDQDATAVLHYGVDNDELAETLVTPVLKKGTPVELTLSGLAGNVRYYYQLKDSQTGAQLAAGSFHTQRPEGSEFTFTVTADSHLDKNADVPLYLQTLENIAQDQPDFHIDLGDTFMTGKHASRENAFLQYMAQRYYFSQLTAPLFLVIGNHDGEEAKQRKGSDSLANWAANMRTGYFPNPTPNNFYSGNTQQEATVGLLEDYYAWQWGDAEFYVLNPYWYASADKKSGRWSLSLGDAQYQWLRDTLARSEAKYKFVFVHQMIGGLDRNGRGGIAGAPFGEWGGNSANGEDDFKTQRPGWDAPIHSLLVRNGVNAVFHGHDHLFATEELDGVIYQLVPQPAHLSFAPPRDAMAYGYTSGTVLGGSGHMRVKVSAEQVIVDYVRVDASRSESKDNNRQVLHSYSLN